MQKVNNRKTGFLTASSENHFKIHELYNFTTGYPTFWKALLIFPLDAFLGNSFVKCVENGSLTII